MVFVDRAGEPMGLPPVSKPGKTYEEGQAFWERVGSQRVEDDKTSLGFFCRCLTHNRTSYNPERFSHSSAVI